MEFFLPKPRKFPVFNSFPRNALWRNLWRMWITPVEKCVEKCLNTFYVNFSPSTTNYPLPTIHYPLATARAKFPLFLRKYGGLFPGVWGGEFIDLKGVFCYNIAIPEARVLPESGRLFQGF